MNRAYPPQIYEHLLKFMKKHLAFYGKQLYNIFMVKFGKMFANFDKPGILLNNPRFLMDGCLVISTHFS